jgi:hypothetical protein
MINLIDYKTLKFNGKIIASPERIRQYNEFCYSKFLVILFIAKEGDIEDIGRVGENVHCYDMQGNLKWKYPLGIVGIAKENEETAILYGGEYIHYVDVATGIEDKDRMTFTK